MSIRKKVLAILLAAALALGTAPLTAMADEAATKPSAAGPAASGEITRTEELPTGAIDNQKIIEEAARESEEKAAAEAAARKDSADAADQEGSGAEGQKGTREASGYDHVGNNASYTLTRNDDGNNTWTLLIGPGSAGTTIYTRQEDTPEIANSSKESQSGVRDRITQVEVAEGVVNLSDYCFYGFLSLRHITLPSTLKAIGRYAFYRCYCLQEISIPDSVTEIQESAFAETCMTPGTVTLPKGCNAYGTAYKKAKVFYDVKYGLAVRPDAPAGTGYLSQFQESYTKIAEILDGLNVDSMTRDIEKIQAIYGWVTSHVKYDYEALDYRGSESESGQRRYNYAGTAHSALFAHQAICSGYVDLTKIMLKEAGIRCIECNGGDHAWLIIEAGGNWYAADPTWDAGYDLYSYTYFLETYGFMAEHDHTWEMDNAFYEFYHIADSGYGNVTIGSYGYRIFANSAALTKYSGNQSSVTLPTSVEYDGVVYPVAGVVEYAFEGNKTLKTLVIPEGYESLGFKAFFDCPALTKVTLPLTLKRINESFNMYSMGLVIYFNGTAAQFMASDLMDAIFTNIFVNSVVCKDKRVDNPYSLGMAKVILSTTKLVYNGKKQMPSVKVVLANGKVLRQNVDYRLILEAEEDYAKNVDEYGLGLDGLGDFESESVSGVASFRIYPQPTTLKKLKAGKKSMTVTWTKKTAQVGGYQIQYALNSSFTKGKKTKTVKGAGKTSLKIKKLKKKKTYYVRIRTYKYAPSIEENLYSTWSKPKKVKVK